MREELWSALRKVRQDKNRLRKNTETIKKTEKETIIDRAGWGVYDSGAKGKFGYFKEYVERSSFEDIVSFEETQKRIAERKEKGEKTLVLDVMGQGRVGYDLGADLSVGWTYQPQGEEELDGRVIETGDLMSEKGLTVFMNNLDKRLEDGYILSDIFFRAIGGYAVYSSNRYAVSYMYDRILRPLWERLDKGGRVYLGLDFGDQVKSLMAALKAEGITVLGPAGDCYVLEKTAHALPSARLLAARQGVTTRQPNDSN